MLIRGQANLPAYLPCGSVSAKVAKGRRKPIVDFVQSQLPFWSFDDGLQSKNRHGTLAFRKELPRGDTIRSGRKMHSIINVALLFNIYHNNGVRNASSSSVFAAVDLPVE